MCTLGTDGNATCYDLFHEPVCTMAGSTICLPPEFRATQTAESAIGNEQNP